MPDDDLSARSSSTHNDDIFTPRTTDFSDITSPTAAETPRNTKENIVLLEELGRGASATVYKAVHIPTLTAVAIKSVQIHEPTRRRQVKKQ